VFEFPQPPIETHFDAIASAKGTPLKHLEATRHIFVVHVPSIIWPRFRTDGIRSRSLTNKKANGKRSAGNFCLLPHKLSRSERVGETLELLERKHSQWEAAPSCESCMLAAKPIMKSSGDEQTQVRLRFAATRRKPHDVHNVVLRFGSSD